MDTKPETHARRLRCFDAIQGRDDVPANNENLQTENQKQTTLDNQNKGMSTETQPTQAVATQPKQREIRVVHDESPLAFLLDSSRFEHMFRIAGAMARASLIPKHLKGESFEQTQANCFLIVNQAMRWQLDPFAIAPETYEIGGKLAFQGKLVAAVINARGGLIERLSYTFNEKPGDALEVTVSGRIDGEEMPRTVTVNVGQAKTQNQMWTKDPHQKLIYTGAIKWARRHKPEVILGVLTDDDAEQIREQEKMERGGKTLAIVKTPKFDGPVVDVAPAAAPQREMHPPAHDTSKPAEPAAETPPADAGQPAEQKATEPNANDVGQLRVLLTTHGVSEKQVFAYCKENKIWTELGENDVPTQLEQIPADKVKRMVTLLAGKSAESLVKKFNGFEA